MVYCSGLNRPTRLHETMFLGFDLETLMRSPTNAKAAPDFVLHDTDNSINFVACEPLWLLEIVCAYERLTSIFGRLRFLS